MKRILITGGFGFVGGRLTKTLLKEYAVIASSRREPTPALIQAHGGPEALLHSAILSPENFPKHIDTVIHLAAVNEWDCVAQPSEAIRINIDETRIILNNAIQNGVKQFLYFSTAHIYKSPLVGEIDESTLPQPQHPYAITHKAAEDYVLAAIQQNKIEGAVFRLSNSFGAPVSADVNRWTLVANDLVRQGVEKGSLTLNSNGCQYRDFITLCDVEMAVKHFVEQPQLFFKRVYNLGAGKAMRVIDMANLIIDRFKAAVPGSSITLHLPANAVATKEPSLDFKIDRLEGTGFTPENDFKLEVSELIRFCKKSFAGVTR